ncbi:MAG: DJ-1/PfpI family protein [Chloroflexi bacterium]|nr:DJ-1/PfpI family protein [Chloroflexota bacterium]MBV9547076.1 DJ-1/PfpI family protein [Chloroflexota bacterium]MBV9898071.1 DJ-1/PfpI family protein [Chloroflexota bacterium]
MTHTLSIQPRTASPATRTLENVARFALHYGEMVLAMYAGMLIYMPLEKAIPPGFQQIGMALFMAWPMVVWMRIRGHGWRHGFEMSAAMLVPWAALKVAANVMPVLANIADWAMYLGMLAYMLVRRDHYAHTGAHHHAAPVAHRFPWRRVMLVAAYVGAIVLTPLVAGTVNLGVKAASETHEPVDPPAYSGALPVPPVPDPNKKTAVVMSGYYGSEIGDTLEAYEILARSGVFNVYSVAPERTVLPLRTGPAPWGNSIDFAPQFSFAEYDSFIGRAPDVIAIPYFQADPKSARDAVVFDWLRGHFGPNTMILGICSGNMVLADSGLAAGRTATTNTGTFDYVQASSPTTRWLHDLRYVDDGNLVTSSNLTSGIDATLHVVDRFAGRATALDIARQIGYTQTGALDDPRFDPPSDNLTQLITDAAFLGPDQRIGVLLNDGVTELGVSGIVDPFEGTFARTYFISAHRGVVRSRDGFLFVPRYDIATVPALDRVVVAASDNGAARQQVLTDWSASKTGPSVEDIFQNVGSGQTAYDASLRDIARTRSSIPAHLIDNTLFYSAAEEDFSDANMIPNEVLVVIFLGGLGAATMFAVSHRRLRRAVRLQTAPQPA